MQDLCARSITAQSPQRPVDNTLRKEKYSRSTDHMASEQGGVSTELPVFSASISPPAVTIPSTAESSTTNISPEPTRTKSLKRSRPEPSYSPPNSGSIANAGLTGRSPSPNSPQFKSKFSPGYYAPPLTGAAAMEDERRRQEANKRRQVASVTENPGHRVMSSLLAVGISKPSDAPEATKSMSEGMSIAANAISVPSMHYDDKALSSPTNVVGNTGSALPAQTATASPTFVASPSAMTSAEPEARDSNSNQRQGNAGHLQPQQQNEQSSNRALTFPGNLLAQADAARGPARGMSLPMPGQQLAPRSPSQKKHKCPYCETEFTRHHNLKSHLLTHSQEKPYVCQTCQMRFRRLHDLKRHMKLHTGERPHICPKCDRKFARGDALARHSKGQGGCAGRRGSVGSFGADDNYDGSNAGDGEEGMEGVAYTNGNPNEVEMSEEDPRRLSLPSIKAQHVQGQGSSDSYAQSRVPSSYPPAGHRPSQPAYLHPPGRDRAASNSSGTSPRIQNNMVGGHAPSNSMSSVSGGGSSIFSQTNMTESPKPLSPSAMQTHQLGHDTASINRQRSPSLTTQFQQQQFGRHQSGRGSPVMSLPSPHTSQGPKLPGLANLAPPDPRYTLQTQSPQNPANGSHPVQLSQQNPNATSPSTIFQPPIGGGRAVQGGVPPHHQPPASSNDSNNLFAKENGLISYVQQLEDKIKQLSDQVQYMEGRERKQEEHIGRLSEEVYALRSQLASQGQNQNQAQNQNQNHPHHPQQQQTGGSSGIS